MSKLNNATATANEGYISFDVVSSTPISEAMAKAITSTESMWTSVQEDGSYMLHMKHVATAQIEQVSVQVNPAFIGVSGTAGEGAKRLFTNLINVMRAASTMTSNLDITNATFNLYKDKVTTPEQSAVDSNMAALFQVTGYQPKPEKGTKSKVNIANLL